MITNPFLSSGDKAIIGMVLCGLFILAAIILPKVFHYRKQLKQNESEKSAPDEEQEVEILVTPNKEDVFEESMTDYKRRFFVNADISTRNGKSVSIRKKYHTRISKIVRTIGDNEVTLFSYIDNVLKHHFETFQSDISGLYEKNSDDDYLIPKK